MDIVSNVNRRGYSLDPVFCFWDRTLFRGRTPEELNIYVVGVGRRRQCCGLWLEHACQLCSICSIQDVYVVRSGTRVMDLKDAHDRFRSMKGLKA